MKTNILIGIMSALITYIAYVILQLVTGEIEIDGFWLLSCSISAIVAYGIWLYLITEIDFETKNEK